MSWKILIVIFVWLFFFSFWVITSLIYRTSKAKRVDKNWFLFLTSIILFTALVEYLTWEYLLKRLELPVPFNQFINLIGIILLLVGFFFAIWARITLGKFWSGSIAIIEGQPVIKHGPYSIARHPIYIGVIAMLWGSFFVVEIGFLLLTTILGTILLIWKARLEESLLEKYKGGEYTAYKKDVRGMFLVRRI
jgi:protein-S-isoprenylcysteine O-methyltransferase Ste14